MASFSERGVVIGGTAAICLAVSAAAVAWAPPSYTRTPDAHIVLAYHDKPVNWAASFCIAAALLLITRNVERTPVRVGTEIVLGAFAAQLAASLVWAKGVPDYLHFFGVIANAADVFIFVGVATILTGMLIDVKRKVAPHA